MMSMSFEDFKSKYIGIQEDLLRDYTGSDSEHMSSLCIILHREASLAQTPSEELIEDYRERGVPIPDDADSHIDFTEEHHKLHHMLQTVAIEGRRAGVGATDMLAMMFVIGRRWGLSEAADMAASMEADMAALLGDTTTTEEK